MLRLYLPRLSLRAHYFTSNRTLDILVSRPGKKSQFMDADAVTSQM